MTGKTRNSSVDQLEDDQRTPRSKDTRVEDQRPTEWRPPDLLPSPDPQPGYKFRWVRVALLGESDPTSTSSRFREGWVPVKAEDHPELQVMGDPTSNSRWKNNIEVGGLVLCKISSEVAEARDAYYRNLADSQMKAVDNNMMREQDRRMPMLKPERRSQVQFGGGKKP